METRKIIADYYCGVDLHAIKNYICVLNPSSPLKEGKLGKNGNFLIKYRRNYNI